MDEITTLQAEAAELLLPAFCEDHALELGARLVALARAGAVSYTHLDVYKRQGSWRSDAPAR